MLHLPDLLKCSLLESRLSVSTSVFIDWYKFSRIFFVLLFILANIYVWLSAWITNSWAPYSPLNHNSNLNIVSTLFLILFLFLFFFLVKFQDNQGSCLHFFRPFKYFFHLFYCSLCEWQRLIQNFFLFNIPISNLSLSNYNPSGSFLFSIYSYTLKM